MNKSENIDEISKALHTFRQQIVQPNKDKVAKGKNFSYNYVTLDSVAEAIDKAIKETGLSYLQSVSSENNEAKVVTLITHESGQWIETDSLGLPTTKHDAQAFGSAITYAKRYSLCAAFGVVADEDDDGSKAKEDAPKLANNTNITVLKNKITEFSQQADIQEQATWISLQKKLNIYNDINKLTIDECALMLKEIDVQIKEFAKK